MKIKILTALSLAAVIGLGGCGKDEAANNTNTNLKANTNVAATPAAPVSDTAAKAAVESALKSKGFTDVTVEATATEVTLRGSIPEGKMTEVNQIVMETAKRKVNNQVVEKK